MTDPDRDPRCSCNERRSQHVGQGGACICCRCPRWTSDWSPVDSLVCGQWPLRLPPFRAYRWARAWHEAARLCALRSVVQPDDVVYEIGAEQGDYGALFATWGAKVVIAEPNPRAWPTIRVSFEANGVAPYAWLQGFVADHEWKTDTNHNAAYGQSGWPAAVNGPLDPEQGFQSIATDAGATGAITLDQLAHKTNTTPNVISVDVEGGELHVLHGAKATLVEHRPVVFVSVHPAFLRDLYETDPAEVHGFMADLGYEHTHLATDHEEHHAYWVPGGRAL